MCDNPSPRTRDEKSKECRDARFYLNEGKAQLKGITDNTSSQRPPVLYGWSVSFSLSSTVLETFACFKNKKKKNSSK